jgi:hypothetical protein
MHGSRRGQRAMGPASIGAVGPAPSTGVCILRKLMARITPTAPAKRARGGFPAAVSRRQPYADQKQPSGGRRPVRARHNSPRGLVSAAWPAAASPRPRIRRAPSCTPASALMQVRRVPGSLLPKTRRPQPLRRRPSSPKRADGPRAARLSSPGPSKQTLPARCVVCTHPLDHHAPKSLTIVVGGPLAATTSPEPSALWPAASDCICTNGTRICPMESMDSAPLLTCPNEKCWSLDDASPAHVSLVALALADGGASLVGSGKSCLDAHALAPSHPTRLQHEQVQYARSRKEPPLGLRAMGCRDSPNRSAMLKCWSGQGIPSAPLPVLDFALAMAWSRMFTSTTHLGRPLVQSGSLALVRAQLVLSHEARAPWL